MSVPVRLSLFAAALVVAFVLGLGFGAAVGPLGDDAPASHSEMPSHG